MVTWDVHLSSNTIQPYCDITETLEGQNYPNYALCLPRYTKLNGAFKNAPDNLDFGGYGYMSTYMSDSNGEFINKPQITITYARVKSSNGIILTFNALSGDYADDVTFEYYRNDILTDSCDFTPNSSVYYCEHKSKMYDKIVITFNSTNNPYRYLWIGKIDQYRLTTGEGIKIVYEDVAVGAKDFLVASSTDIKAFDDINSLKSSNVSYPNYAMCLPRYSKLDGTYQNVTELDGEIGYISNSISDASGNFSTPPVLTLNINSTDTYSSVGLGFTFNTISGDYAKDINIKWYFDNTLIKSGDYTADNYQWFCNENVEHYNKVVITFKSTSKPFRNIFLSKFDFGLVRIFKDDEVVKATCIQEIAPISDVISINTLDFTVRNKTDIVLSFQQKQPLKLYFDDNLMGIFYVTSSKRLSENRYTINSGDLISILDGEYFYGGMYENALAKDVIGDIMGDYPYEIDDALKDATITGYIPYDTKRKALSLIAFTIGAIIDTSFDTIMHIYPYQLPETIETLTDKEVFLGKTSIDNTEVVTGVKLTSYMYAQSDTKTDIYNGDTVLSGDVTVITNEPHWFWYSNAQIIENGDNYCIIRCGSDPVLLSCNNYSSITAVTLKENPRITINKKIAEVKDVTLLNPKNIDEVTNRIYNWYVGRPKVQADILVGQHELGDYVRLNTFDGVKEGMITSMNYTFTGEMRANVTIE